MKNISNLEISSEKCTKCTTCGKSSWYIMMCDCGHIFCKNCSAYKNNEDYDEDSDLLLLECPKCGATELFV